MVLIKEPSGFFEEVQSRATRLSSPPLVEVLKNGHPIPIGRETLTAVVRPGLADCERQTASAESEGLVASWHERADGRVTAPVIPGSRDVHRRRRNEPVDRSCPVDIHILSEPSVRFNPFGAAGDYSRHAYRARLATLVDIYCIIPLSRHL